MGEERHASILQVLEGCRPFEDDFPDVGTLGFGLPTNHALIGLCGTQRPTVALLGLHGLRRTSPLLSDSFYCIDATVTFKLKAEK